MEVMIIQSKRVIPFVCGHLKILMICPVFVAHPGYVRIAYIPFGLSMAGISSQAFAGSTYSSDYYDFIERANASGQTPESPY
jgi:hypothetical protein